MANQDSNSRTLTQDVNDVIGLSYPIEALLHGALALLDGHLGEDRNGDVFQALQLVELAEKKAQEIYTSSDNLKIIERTGRLEYAGVRHD